MVVVDSVVAVAVMQCVCVWVVFSYLLQSSVLVSLTRAYKLVNNPKWTKIFDKMQLFPFNCERLLASNDGSLTLILFLYLYTLYVVKGR